MPSTGVRRLARQVRTGPRVRIAEQVIVGLCDPHRDGLFLETRGWREPQWAAARFAVQVHGIGPLLHARTRVPRATEGAAAAFAAYAADCHTLNARRYALWRGELERVAREAARLSIPLLALKGAALLPLVWPEPALRPTSDIDLLARPSDRGAIDDLLRANGWTLQGEVPRHRSFYLTRLGLNPRHEEGEHPDQPLRLEVHEHARQTFLGLSHDGTAALWHDASRVPLGSTTIVMAEAGSLFEHVLIHTAFDLAKRLTRLIKLEDLRLLAPRLSDDAWSRLVANAHASGLERFYLAPLLLAERYLGPVAPTEVVAALEAATPRSLVAWLRRMPLSYFTVCGSLGGGPANIWPRLRWLPTSRARMAGARLLVAPRRGERLDELAAVGHGSGLWAYYRAQLARWRS